MMQELARPLAVMSESAAGDRLRVLLVLGHPRPGSLCDALADAFAEGALAAGVELRRLAIRDLRFERDVLQVSPRDQLLEPGIVDAIEQIRWAQHLVFVFPTWWGTMPAAMKGFLDRVLLPGFAFADRDDGEGWEKLLAGRSAHLLTTMDTPPWVYRWIYGSPGLNAIDLATLGFCGITPVRRTIFGSVKESTSEQRVRWIEQARAEGARLVEGVRTKREQRRDAIAAWITAFRLKFHPMAWAAYAIGALAFVAGSSGRFDALPFWIGLACLFTLELATVFINELVDFDSDRRNRHFGPFTGGSRVLVEGKISHPGLRAGTVIALGAFVMLAVRLFWTRPFLLSQGLPVLAALAVLAIFYTAPPLKLCWRGLGELDVAITHSIGVMLAGYVFQGGFAFDRLPWLLSLPLAPAVFAAIALSGIPDYEADRDAGKRTLAVLFGPRMLVRLVQAATLIAALAVLLVREDAQAGPLVAGLPWIALPYAMFQLVLLQRYLNAHKPPGRIDVLMTCALTNIIWFVGVPLWHLAG